MGSELQQKKTCKQTYSGLTMEAMRVFVEGRKNEVAMAEFNRLCAEASYPIVKSWFLSNYKDAYKKTESTIYERMREQSFQAEYRDAKTDILRGAVLKMTNSLSAAVEAVQELMESDDVNPAVRLQVAQTIIGNAVKLSERLSFEETINRETRNPLSAFVDFL